MESGIIAIEVVVVVGQTHEIFCTGIHIELHQFVGVPRLCLPQIVNLHEACLGWMPIVLHMVVILWVSLYVHLSGIPVSRLGYALCGPMSPYAELGVAEPIRCPVSLQRSPFWLKGAGSNG